jgi:hypothetical protein
MENEQLDNKEQDVKRPTFLLVLCILTFVNTGLTVLIGLMGMLNGKPSPEEIKAGKVDLAKSIDQLEKLNVDYWVDLLKRIDAMTDAINANFVAYNGVSVIVAIIGAFAAFLMFQAKKVGFHAYIVYSFLYVIQGYLFISPSIMPAFVIIINFVIAGIFILLYSRNLSWMNK